MMSRMREAERVLEPNPKAAQYKPDTCQSYRSRDTRRERLWHLNADLIVAATRGGKRPWRFRNGTPGADLRSPTVRLPGECACSGRDGVDSRCFPATAS